MAKEIFILIGIMCFTCVTPKSYSSGRSRSYLSCTSYNFDDYVILDCYYSGGLPFPTLSWTGPNGLHEVKRNAQRFSVNVTRDMFVNQWDTIYKCKAKYWLTSSYCYVGRGIGSYVGIAFGVLGLLILLCIFIVCVGPAVKKLPGKFKRRHDIGEFSPANVSTGYKNPAFKSEPEHGQEGKTPE